MPKPSRTVPSLRRSPRPTAADLHVHTTHSDGVCSPCEVVIAADCVGLSALAITDHDTLSALAVARPEAARLGIELIAGIESEVARAEAAGNDDGAERLRGVLDRLTGWCAPSSRIELT